MFTHLTTFTMTMIHMEADLHLTGHLLCTNGSQLLTLDKTSGRISLLEPDNSNPSFNVVVIDFLQISDHQVAVIEWWQHCIWLLNRRSLTKSPLAGTCDKKGHKDGMDALLSFPRKIIADSQNTSLAIILDLYNRALRHLNIRTGAECGCCL